MFEMHIVFSIYFIGIQIINIFLTRYKQSYEHFVLKTIV